MRDSSAIPGRYLRLLAYLFNQLMPADPFARWLGYERMRYGRSPKGWRLLRYLMLPSRRTIANADMIPPFQDRGYLPPGVHPATLDEVEARFGRQSELRCVQMESIRWLVDLARRAGVARLVINGSFVTDVPEPNDVDCVLLVEPGFPFDPSAEAELIQGLPFLDMKLVSQDGWDELVETVFASDRCLNPKGMIEVVSWN